MKAAARTKTLPANITKKESHQAQTLARAALVRAWVEPKKRGRPELNGKDSPFNFDVGSFAALGINGESSSFLTVKEWARNRPVIKIRAERKMGEMLKPILKPGNPQWSHDGTIVKLADIDLTKNQSSRYQAIASIPEQIFEGEVAKVISKKDELTSKGMIGLAKSILKTQNQETKAERKSGGITHNRGRGGPSPTIGR